MDDVGLWYGWMLIVWIPIVCMETPIAWTDTPIV